MEIIINNNHNMTIFKCIYDKNEPKYICNLIQLYNDKMMKLSAIITIIIIIINDLNEKEMFSLQFLFLLLKFLTKREKTIDEFLENFLFPI